MKSQDFKRLVEMLVHFKVTLDVGASSSYAILDFGFQVMGGVVMDPYEDLSGAVERAGLANLTSLMANVLSLKLLACRLI